MKKLIVFLIFIIAISQTRAQEQPLLAKIQYGETLFLDGLNIEFQKVIPDSRCPEGSNCGISGEAKVLINIYTGYQLLESKEIAFYPSDVINKMKSVLFKDENMLINALNLSAYPEVHHRIPEKMYCLDIAIY